jgi:hypothetical protein
MVTGAPVIAASALGSKYMANRSSPAADQEQKSTTPATGVSKGEVPQDQKGISEGAAAALGTILDDEEKEKGK